MKNGTDFKIGDRVLFVGYENDYYGYIIPNNYTSSDYAYTVDWFRKSDNFHIGTDPMKHGELILDKPLETDQYEEWD